MDSTDPTQHTCPAPSAHGHTHHLKQRDAGGGAMVCSYCGQTQAQLRTSLLAGAAS
jgi:hypothetical protein